MGNRLRILSFGVNLGSVAWRNVEKPRLTLQYITLGTIFVQELTASSRSRLRSLLPAQKLVSMKFLASAQLLGAITSLGISSVIAQNGYQVPAGSPGFYHGNSTAKVTFDQYSLFLDDSRTLFLSGEFHPFRLPSPELWKDVLQKFKAAGLNGVSVYWHWGLTSPRKGVNRWTHHNDIVKFLKLCQEVGLLAIVRPGPYINAESSGGGLPAWLTNVPALARTNATLYRDAWHPYIKEFAELSAPFQYPNGPLIGIQSENEFSTSAFYNLPAAGLEYYMQDVIDTYRAGGLTKIPTTHNDNWPKGMYASGVGAVDLYGWDGYPALFDCRHPDTWPEMNTGGTCWGNLGTESIYSSYDYGAALREDRTITPKLGEIKLQSFFLHASPAYMTADRVGDGSQATGTAYSDSSEVYTTVWHDSKSGTNFYVVRQTSNAKITKTEFTLRVNSTVLGNNVVVPSSGVMALNGRESKVIVTDYSFGSSKLIFSTAEVLTWQTFDGIDYIYLYTNPTDSVEIVVQTSSVSGGNSTQSGFTITNKQKYTVISGSANRSSSIAAISIGKAVVLIADKAVALASWAPRVTSGKGVNYYTPSPQVAGVIITGPYFVRTASLKGSTLTLQGDINTDTTIDIWGPSSIKTVTWNGKTVSVSRNSQLKSLRGKLQYNLGGNKVKIPDISKGRWKCIDNTPEISASFDDSTWVVANKTTTARPQQPYEGKYVLYGSEYGFHAGDLIWRGHFDGNATGVNLSIQTGFSGAMSVFINSKFLGSAQGSSEGWSGVDILNGNYTFTPDLLRKKGNVITVYHDNTGLASDYNKPRGVVGYKLLSTNGNDFTKWTVSGNVGGEYAPDDVRGQYNEGGWYYERIGAHLPGFDDSRWSTCTPYKGRDTAGITVYRTEFELDIPDDADVPLAFDFELDTAAYRSVIWVNGWQFGRFASTLGPQTSYPVPEGILDHQGKNEVVVTLWALNGTAKMKKFELNKRAVISSSKTSRIGLVNAPDWKDLRD
ncbi:hypothetical protein FRC15_011091 [Serendipita sp. 397]|nr:hypothetical protein FRC15_011091 [Serendipita sp. 397]